jgi:sugar lactone lactonase YvrE
MFRAKAPTLKSKASSTLAAAAVMASALGVVGAVTNTATAAYGDVSTLAGGTSGFVDGNGSAAKFYYPNGLTVAPNGNVYLADMFNQAVRIITPSGTVSTLTSGEFSNIADVAVDSSGTVYAADYHNHRIAKITSSGVVTTLAGGSGSGFADGNGASAKFNNPNSLAIGPDGAIYVADRENHRVRRVTPSGDVTTFAGSTQGYVDANGTSAKFDLLSSVAFGPGGKLYVSDARNGRIRVISTSGDVTTLNPAGGDYGTGMAVDSNGYVFFTVSGN